MIKYEFGKCTAKYLVHIIENVTIHINLIRFADGTHLRSRSSTRCQSTGAVLTESSVQNAMAKAVNSAEAWADTHWMIYWTRKVAKTTPMPAQESWGHQGSLALVSLGGGSPTRASAMSCDSITALWSVNGATLGGWSIIPALPT